ncbi:hypothetical protein D9M71_442440 [compost metagenome]
MGQALEAQVHEPGEQGDPGHVRQYHVHGQVAAHQENPVAQAIGGGNRFGGNQEQPGRAQHQAQGDQQARQQLRQDHPQDQGPGGGAEGLRLDQQLLGDFPGPLFQIPGQDRGDADHDQHHLGQLAQAEDDEQDRQDGQWRHHRQHRQQRRQGRAEQRQGAGGNAQAQTGQRTDPKADAQPLQARARVLPEQVGAATFVLFEGHAFDRIAHLHGAGEQLVVRVLHKPGGRAHEVGTQQQGERQDHQQQAT